MNLGYKDRMRAFVEATAAAQRERMTLFLRINPSCWDAISYA